MAANPERATPFADLVPELLELARGDYGPQLTQEIDHVDDESVGDIPVRVYRDDGEPTGLVVYFHGGGHVIGSIGIMDGVAREIAHASGAVVVSVAYRLAPEHPYPAAVDDCTEVTSWALGQCARFGLPDRAVAVAGESAGGTMAAAVSLRLRDAGGPAPVGQVLIYPAVAGSKIYPSREEFSGLVISLEAGEAYWAAYSGGRDLDDDPYAVPLSAPSLAGLPPALVHPRRVRHAAGRGTRLRRPDAGRRRRRRGGLLPGPAPWLRQLRVPGRRASFRAHGGVAAAHVPGGPGGGVTAPVWRCPEPRRRPSAQNGRTVPVTIRPPGDPAPTPME